MCVKYCIVSFLGQVGGWEVYSFPCGETCCKTSFEMCMTSDGVDISQVTYSSEAEPGVCSSNDIGQDQVDVLGHLECPRGTVYSYPCYSDCYRLNYFY